MFRTKVTEMSALRIRPCGQTCKPPGAVLLYKKLHETNRSRAGQTGRGEEGVRCSCAVRDDSDCPTRTDFHHATQFLRPNKLQGRRRPQLAGPGHQWEPLRNNRWGWGLLRRECLRNRPEWHADPAGRLLRGEQLPRGGARPGHQWRPLRDNVFWRGQRWHGLQDHPYWQADDALHLLLPKRVPGRGDLED